MADTRGNLQDEFLNQFNHLKVISFDNYVILVEDDGGVQRLIYKHAVSTITIEQNAAKKEQLTAK